MSQVSLAKPEFLLDTNIVSEFKKPLPNAGCIAWLESHAEQSAISVITVAELRYGIDRLPHGKRKTQRQQEFAFLLEDFRGRFFDFDGFAAGEWGRYAAELETHYGTDWWKQVDLKDTQIAAIAREYGLTVVTRNDKYFPFCPVLNPFSS